MGSQRRAVQALIAAALYTAFAFLFTHQAWADPAHVSIGFPGDSYKFQGFLGWYPFALTHGLNPLHLSYMNLPGGSNAMWDTTMPLPAVIIWPVTLLFGVIPAFNVLLLLGLASDGLCTYLWLRRHSGGLAAFIGGVLVAFGPYTAPRAYAHLNLLLFFAIPLMLMVIEDMLREPRRDRVRRGLLLGVLAAVQLFCTEEILALAATAVVIAVIVIAVLERRQAVEWLRAVLPAAGVAAAVFVVLAGPALFYQFFGPLVPNKPVQAFNTNVTDLVNFIVPTSVTAISPGGPQPYLYTHPWTGNWVEWNGYIGIPLILVALFTAVRWRRNRWLLTVSITTLVLAILSLGPHLHVDGHTFRAPLPGDVMAHLPVVENIVPSRLALPIDMGLAALLAVFIDRALHARSWRLRGPGLVAAAVTCASVFPAIGVPTASPQVPAYFSASGDVHRLAPGTVALVFPIPYVGPDSQSPVPAVWQAESGFQIKLVSGAGNSINRARDPVYGVQVFPLRCVLDLVQVGPKAPRCGAVDSVVRDQLRSLGVRVVIVGPMPAQDRVVSYFTSLLGTVPVPDQGVLLWHL